MAAPSSRGGYWALSVRRWCTKSTPCERSLLGVGPFVAEQLRFVEVEQDLPVRFDVAIIEFRGDAGGQPGSARADAGNVAGHLADAQAGRVVEAVDVGEERRRAGLLLGELQIWPEPGKPPSSSFASSGGGV